MSSNTINIGGFHGDGIGPEVYPYYRQLLEAANQVLGEKRFHIDDLPYDGDYFETSSPNPAERRLWSPETPDQLLERYKTYLLTACGHPRVGMAHAYALIINFLRNKLATNMNERPIWLPHPDLRPEVVKRPINMEVFAVDKMDQSITEDVQNEGTETESVTIVERHPLAAFKAKLCEAVKRAKILGVNRIAVAHKANILKFAHGSWNEVIREIQGENPDIKIEPELMDSFLAKVVQAPDKIPTIIVTDWGFGDILEKVKTALHQANRPDAPRQFHNIIARENVNGMYISRGGIEGQGDERVGEQVGEYSYKDVYENIKASIQIASQNKFSRVTVVHRGSVHPKTQVLWERVARELQQANVDIQIDSMDLGDYVAGLLTNPEELNGRVFACTNLGGDLAGDATAGLVGGLGIPATHSWNTSGKGTRYFEFLGGTAPDIAGKGIANPVATILTGAEVLAAFNEMGLRDSTHQAVQRVLARRDLRTPDMGGSATTRELGDAIIAEFSRLAI